MNAGPRAVASRAAIALIRGYQQLLSPFLGGQCRFVPSCSEYAIGSIERFGSMRGAWLGLRRIVRCQPLCAGGHDPVPERFTWRRRAESDGSAVL